MHRRAAHRDASGGLTTGVIKILVRAAGALVPDAAVERGAADMSAVVTDPDDGEVVICGGATPTDLHLASIVHCVDGEIIEWLSRRERRRRDKGNHQCGMGQAGAA